MGAQDDSSRDGKSESYIWSEPVTAPMDQRRSSNDNNTATCPSGMTAPARLMDLVDTTLASLATGFRDLRNFPANITELKERMQREQEARLEEERETWRRWTGSSHSPDHAQMVLDRLPAEFRQEALDDRRYDLHYALDSTIAAHRDVPVRKIAELYHDTEHDFGMLDRFAVPMLSFGGACYYKSETVENLPSTARWGWPAPRQRWLSPEWFKRDPYSPIQVEACPETRDEDGIWRAAFQDLLCASVGREMLPYWTEGALQFLRGISGLSWMTELLLCGQLPPPVLSPLAETSPLTLDRFLKSRYTDTYASAATPVRRSEILARLDRHAWERLWATYKVDVFAAADVSVWTVPDTEEDLYEAMLPVLYLEGTAQDDDRYELQAKIRNDLYDGRVVEAAEGLKAFRTAHDGAFEDVISSKDADHSPYFREDYLTLLRDALNRSGIPESRLPWLATAGTAHSEDAPRKVPPQPPAQSPAQPPAPLQPLSMEVLAGSEILAQLTTTQTTRLPDGSVVTKMVLKQRFADGREETSESVQTIRGQGPDATSDAADDGTGSKPQSTGWFWS